MTTWARTSLGTVSTGELATTILPKYPKAPGTMPGVIYLHGNTGTAVEPLDPAFLALVAPIADIGHPVLSGDWGGPSAWANDTALARVTAGRTYLQASMGAKAGKVILVGTSMGGLTALAWAAANTTLVACVVAFLPVCDVSDVVTNNRASLAAVVNAAYSGGWSQATYGATHNPVTMAAAGKYAGLPMRLFYGTTDAIVLPSTITTLAASTGASTVATSIPGGHASATLAGIDPATVLTFVQAHS